MRVVESRHRSFPWAFVVSENQKGSSSYRIDEINRWLVENDLWYNSDYLNFELVEKNRSVEFTSNAIAFKDRSKALMFKLAWA